MKRLTAEEFVGDTVVRRFGDLPKRTLQRKLHEAGTSYRQLVRDTRCGIAKLMLTNGYSSTAAARECEFKTLAAFCRAFRTWTGLTPSAWVRAQKGW